MTVETYTLAPSWTISAWIRADNIDNDMVLFSKDKASDYPNSTLFSANVEATSGSLKFFIQNTSDNSVQTFTGTQLTKVSAATWEVVGFSMQVNVSAVDSEIRCWVGDGAGIRNTLNSAALIVYLDDPAGYTSFIGAQRTTGASDWNTEFVGFVYSFYMYNQAYITDSDSPHVGLGTGNCEASCDTLDCTDVAN
jgi:hypothetical protein